jgi:hypothetical protein
MSDSEDEDIKRAIALSLQQEASSTPAGSTPGAAVNLISSDEDEDDLDAPLRIHKQKQKQPQLTKVIYLSDDEPDPVTVSKEGTKRVHSPSNTQPSIDPDNSSKPRPQPAPSALLGLDRKQMEAERLARAQKKKQEDEEQLSRKRKASTSLVPPSDQEGRIVEAKFWRQSQPTLQGKEAKDTTFLTDLTSKAKSPKVSTTPTLPKVMSFKEQQALQAPGIQYPDGVVKRTWVKGFPREDDIKIEDVFQKDDLELAVLSSFQVDPDWVADKLIEGTRVVWVLQAKDDDEVSAILTSQLSHSEEVSVTP